MEDITKTFGLLYSGHIATIDSSPLVEPLLAYLPSGIDFTVDLLQLLTD